MASRRLLQSIWIRHQCRATSWFGIPRAQEDGVTSLSLPLIRCRECGDTGLEHPGTVRQLPLAFVFLSLAVPRALFDLPPRQLCQRGGTRDDRKLYNILRMFFLSSRCTEPFLLQGPLAFLSCWAIPCRLVACYTAFCPFEPVCTGPCQVSEVISSGSKSFAQHLMPAALCAKEENRWLWVSRYRLAGY